MYSFDNHAHAERSRQLLICLDKLEIMFLIFSRKKMRRRRGVSPLISVRRREGWELWSKIIKSLALNLIFLKSRLSADQTDLLRPLVSAATVFGCHHMCLRVCVMVLIKVYGEKQNGSLRSVFFAPCACWQDAAPPSLSTASSSDSRRM